MTSWRKVIDHCGLQVHVHAYLTCVRPEVRLQVGALGVGLPTASKSTRVCRSPFPRPGPATPLRLGVHHFQRGGRRGEEDPLPGRRLLLHTHGRVLPEHRGEMVMVVRPCESDLHSRVRVGESPRCAAAGVGVEALRERQRGAVAHVRLLLALGAHQVVRAERRRHAAHHSLWGVRQPWLLLVCHHAGHIPLVLDFGAALGH